MDKKVWWKSSTVWIIIGVLVIAFFIMNRPVPVTSEEIAKCIGENSVLYVRLGCSHCETQKEMFGENRKYLNIVDCFYVSDPKCDELRATPTWVIKGMDYAGVQSIDKLKELTGC